MYFKAASEFSSAKQMLFYVLTPEEQVEQAMFRVIVGHDVTQRSKENPWDMTPDACASPSAVTSSFHLMAGEFGSLGWHRMKLM